MTDDIKTASSNEDELNDKTPQQKPEEAIGLLPSILNFMTSFFMKPWQLALGEVKLCNKKQVTTFVMLYLSFFFAETSITFSDTPAFVEVSGFFGFVFVLSAIIATVFFGLGLSSKVAKLASKIVLGVMTIALLKFVWDMVETLIELSEYCGRNCGNLLEMMFSDFGLGEQLIDFISIGMVLIIPTFFLLFPCAFGKKAEENENLRVKLAEINAVEVNTKQMTNDDIHANMDELNKKGKALFQAGVSKVKGIDVEALKQGAGEKAAELNNGNMKLNALNGPNFKLIGACLLLLVFVWWLFPSSLEHPDAKQVERLIKNDPQMQQAQALSQLFGKSASLSIDVDDIDNCDEYAFDDGDTGVVCDVSLDVSIAGTRESSVDRMIFFNHPSKGWQYIGDD